MKHPKYFTCLCSLVWSPKFLFETNSLKDWLLPVFTRNNLCLNNSLELRIKTVTALQSLWVLFGMCFLLRLQTQLDETSQSKQCHVKASCPCHIQQPVCLQTFEKHISHPCMYLSMMKIKLTSSKGGFGESRENSKPIVISMAFVQPELIAVLF